MTGYPVQGFVLLDHLLVAMIERSGVECIRMGTNVYYYFEYDSMPLSIECIDFSILLAEVFT